MKVDLNKSGLENIIDLVRKSAPSFRGTVDDITMTHTGLLDHPSGRNSMVEITATGDGVYEAGDSRVLFYDRNDLSQYVDFQADVYVPAETEDEDLETLIHSGLGLRIPEIRDHLVLTPVQDPESHDTGTFIVGVTEDLSACIAGNVSVTWHRDPLPGRSLADDLPVTELDGFEPLHQS